MIDDVLGKLVADKYRIESLVSESESGDIFTGRDEVRDKPVIVKILSSALAIDARWVKRFIDEARAASSITHPNILNITDFGTDAKNISYAVFEQATGTTLRETVSAKGPLDETRALNIARQIAAAVSVAHEKKVIHGRLNPDCVYVETLETGLDEVKVSGFGSDAKYVARDADPRYLAPEQCTADPYADERSDVYSLGVMLYEMLSGVVPFDAATAKEILAKQNSGPPTSLSAFRRDLHPELEPIILSAMAADPDRRYPAMSAFAQDLELLSTGKVATPAAAAAGAPKNLWQTAFIVLAGITLLSMLLIYATSVRKTDATAKLEADPGSLPVQPIGPATGAQEESLAKLPEMTEAEIMAASAGTMEVPPGTLPGGDGYNAWANSGGAPPAGAPATGAPPTGMPPPQYVLPGGQTVTIDPNGGSQFMPNENGIILVPVPMQTNTNTAAKPTPTPKSPAGNTAVQPSPTPKPMATPLPKSTKPGTKPAGKPPAQPGKPSDS
ncbi:MAG: protein kinase domain-containing protein [Pyrinomonadaceae bacterium]